MNPHQMIIPEYGQEPANAHHMAFSGGLLFVHDGTVSREVLLAGNPLTVGDLTITDANPMLIFIETDASADNGRYEVMVKGEEFIMRTRDDADSAGAEFMKVERTGTVVDDITFTSSETTFKGDLTVTDPNPRHTFIETDAAADNGRYEFIVKDEEFIFRTRDDAGSSGADFMKVERTGTVVDGITFTATTTTISNALTVVGAISSNGALTIDNVAGGTGQFVIGGERKLAGEFIGQYTMRGHNDLDADTSYAQLLGKIVDPANGSEEGQYEIFTLQAGSLVQSAQFNKDGLTLAHNDGVLTGDGTAADQDLMTVDEGSVDASRPRIFWNESDDKFEFTKGLTVTGTGKFGGIIIDDATDIVINTTTGTKIGTATSQKISVYGVTPIVQGAAVADASGGATIDAEARTAINALIARVEAFGIIST